MQQASDLTCVRGHEREWLTLNIKSIYFGSWAIHLLKCLFPRTGK